MDVTDGWMDGWMDGKTESANSMLLAWLNDIYIYTHKYKLDTNLEQGEIGEYISEQI